MKVRVDGLQHLTMLQNKKRKVDLEARLFMSRWVIDFFVIEQNSGKIKVCKEFNIKRHSTK